MTDEIQFERPGNVIDPELTKHVLAVVEALENQKVPEKLIAKLSEAMPFNTQVDPYNEKFDLRQELGFQIQMVRGLRKEIFNKDGSLKADYGVDDANRILNNSRDLLKLLQSSHDDLVNYARIQAIETAFLDTVADMPMSKQEQFRSLLAVYLEKHDTD